MRSYKFLPILLLILAPLILSAQDTNTTRSIIKKEIILNKGTDLSKLESLKNLNLDVEVKDMGENDENAAFFGIYPADLDFPKAQSLKYPDNYGVLITGVVPNSPAYEARLIEDDIIMEIDAKKAYDLKEFNKLKAAYRKGDKVDLKIFRNGEIMHVDLVFGAYPQPEEKVIPGKKPEPKKYSVGSGSFEWLPTFYDINMDDINALMESMNFAPFSDKGMYSLLGFGLRGNVGKGWFLGAEYHHDGDYKKVPAIGDNSYINIMDYRLSSWGFSVDKKVALGNRVSASLGFAAGRAWHRLNLVHTNGDFTWPNTFSGNYSATIKKSYAMVQPRAGLMVKLMDGFGLKAEVGYIYGLSPTEGWKESYSDTEIYEIKNSPDTKLSGMTYSVGPFISF